MLLRLALLLASAPTGAPSDTTNYVVLNHGRAAGEMLVVSTGDTVVVKYHHVDRNRGPRSEARYVLSQGRVIGGRTWNLPLNGVPATLPEPADRFEVVRDSVFWRGTGKDSIRGAPFTPRSYYRLSNFTPYNKALLARFLLAQPNRSAALLPRGTARLSIVGDTTVRTSAGRQHLRLVMMRDSTGEATGVWLDDHNELVADEVGWFITVRRGSEEALPALRVIEMRFRDANGVALGRRLAPPPASAIAVTGGDLFDSDLGTVRPRTTVLIQGSRIVAVGPADSVTVPAGATIIDATGKTLMPGMWDMHSHMFSTSQTTRAVADLAAGITTVRDLASDLDMATSLRDRSAAGLLAAPRMVLAGFIEGPGRWAGPSAAIASTEAEALAWVARYDSAGYKQIKLYNLVQQDLVPVIARETHRRGMRLSGHVPRGLSTPGAVRLGFDEINHIAFLLSTFYPDSLYLPEMRAYSAVASAVAPGFDIDRSDFAAMLALFKERGTVIDPTVNLWLSPRAQGGVPAPNVGIPTTSDSLAQRSDATLLRIIKRLYDTGVTIVPGTDGSNYNSELENYERAGIPAAQVLRIATIVPARVMKDDKEYGSIAVGKVADLFIVGGKPAEHVADLRKVEKVIRAGRLYDSKALRNAVGGGDDL
ncbi:MAG TPA: amidohydrolase family protein [Gemmatimonadales bacterium]|nr:amidohydrolase family protein [Gemmatimonadales bacterium]